MQSENLGKREKSVYVTPQLTVHGTIEEITAEQNKTYGLSDGFLFQGAPIKNVS